MATATRRWRGTMLRRSSPLLALLTLLAVVVMHGPSSDHHVLMPLSEHAMAAGSGPTADHGTARHQAHAPAEAAVEHVRTPGVVPSGGAHLLGSGAHPMAHSECVATLRGDHGRAHHTDAVVTTIDAASPAVRLRAPTPTIGGPPPRPPDLDRLCISRT